VYNYIKKSLLIFPCRDKSAVQNRRCKVIYSYKENNNDELTLAVGDVIEVIGEVEEGWWRGKLGARVGVFPSNFVEAIDLSALPVSANRLSATTQIIQTNNIQNKINKSHLSSSREDLVSSNTDLSLHDAPSLPPKPGKCVTTLLSLTIF
jgi:SH3 domain-containing protein 21